jgi:hypothetical protein
MNCVEIEYIKDGVVYRYEIVEDSGVLIVLDERQYANPKDAKDAAKEVLFRLLRALPDLKISEIVKEFFPEDEAE